MRFTKVHLAALAFVAGVLPAAAWADGWFSRAGETKEVTLNEILKSPHDYLDVEVEFKVYFDALGKNFNPYFTQFGEDQYGNFSAWPIDARLYEKRDFERPYPFFFASKFTKAWKKVKDIDHLRVVELKGVVRQVFRGQPWIEVLSWSSASGGLDEDDVRNVIHGDAAFVAGNYKEAAKLYDRADSSNLPDGVRADIQRRLGDACFHMGEYGDALDAYRTGLRCMPDNPVLRQGADAADAARQRARSERKGEAVDGAMPEVASQDQPVVENNGVDEVIRLLEDPDKVQAEVVAWREALEARAAELRGEAPGATPVAGTEEQKPVEEPAAETPTEEVTEPAVEVEKEGCAGTSEPVVETEGCAEQPSGCAEQPAEEPTEAAEPTETEEPAEAGKPVETAEPEAAQPVEAEKPAEAGPVETAEPAEAEKPVETAEPVEVPAEPTGESACGGGIPEEGCATEEPAAEPTETAGLPVEEPVWQGDERVVWVSGQMIRLPRLPFFGAEDVTDDDLRAIIEDVILNPETDE
ncbi:MAG TPA: hypothetical protein VFY93_11400 [Planctomycetota bacterium]|nr:hypothetical protein [Planctomycetota bacterium]